MPVLKDLVCQVLWAETASAFPEYGTQYGDGVVETYIAIPNHPQPFSIRLASRKFIYEGLAVLVFIDGEYQCNRNRVNLRPAKKDASAGPTLVDLVMKQKEKPIGDGSYVGREWRFDDYNFIPELPDGVDEGHFRDLGTIEVIVLRCRASTRDEGNLSTTSSGEDSDVFVADKDGVGRRQARVNRGRVASATDPAPGASLEKRSAKLASLFDGPGDQQPVMCYGIPGDAPPPSYPSWNWERARSSTPYTPHEASPYARGYPATPNLQYQGRQSHAHRATAHAPQYENIDYQSARPERRVHFDFGDGRGPQHHRGASSRSRYDDQMRYHGSNTWRDEHEYGRAGPGPAYREPNQHARPNPYSDYPEPQPSDDRHYMYDAERNVYGYYPEVRLLHEVFGTHSPPIGPFIPQPVQVHHPFYPVQGNPLPGAVPIPIHTPLQFQHVPLPSNPPPVYPPPPFPVAPWNVGQPQPPTQHYPVPIWIPTPAGPVLSHGPGPVPTYPPPGNVPLFHTRAPIPVMTRVPTVPVTAVAGSEPHADASGAKADTADKPKEDQESKDDKTDKADKADKTDKTDQEKKKDSSKPKDTQDPVPTLTADGWPTNTPAAANATKNNTANVYKPPTPPVENNDFVFTNDTTANDGEDWQNEKNDDNDQNKGSDEKQSGGGWDNDNNDSTSNAGKVGKRALYGPHGAYYTSKALTAKAKGPDVEEEPRYDVPKAIADKLGASKQVQPGQGFIYTKKRCVPQYIDSLDEPYARFVFKYRTKEALKKEIGLEVSKEPTPNEDVNALENMEKAQLIEMVLRAKGALGGKIPSPPPKPAAVPVSTQFCEPIPVTAPTLDFLSYKLPPGRAVSNGTGLGIQESNSGNANASSKGDQKENNWDTSAPNWQEDGTTDQTTTNTNTNQGVGWDGVAEQSPENLSAPEEEASPEGIADQGQKQQPLLLSPVRLVARDSSKIVVSCSPGFEYTPSEYSQEDESLDGLDGISDNCSAAGSFYSPVQPSPPKRWPFNKRRSNKQIKRDANLTPLRTPEFTKVRSHSPPSLRTPTPVRRRGRRLRYPSFSDNEVVPMPSWPEMDMDEPGPAIPTSPVYAIHNRSLPQANRVLLPWATELAATTSLEDEPVLRNPADSPVHLQFPAPVLSSADAAQATEQQLPAPVFPPLPAITITTPEPIYVPGMAPRRIARIPTYEECIGLDEIFGPGFDPRPRPPTRPRNPARLLYKSIRRTSDGRTVGTV
ncbi:hypothetical protein ABEF95_009452 [Exophiala dermatitidis]